MSQKNISLENIYQFLLILLAFSFPLTVFGGNLIILIIVMVWLLSGSYKSKIEQIFSSKLLIASIVFFSLHVVGLLWTENIMWGLHIVKKMWYFLLLLPILYTTVNSQYIKYYISAFLVAISFTEICSYLIWFEIIDPFKNATINNPTPFMSHISYNPILAFSIYLVAHEIFFNEGLGRLKLFFYIFFSISMSINMFITGGRAGQVMFFAMLLILIFQYFRSQKLKAFLLASILVPAIFFLAYQTSDIFHNRVDIAIDNVANYSLNKNTSVGQRMAFAMNSWEIIKENPFIGVGTGDFPIEYRKVNQINTAELLSTTNPHNMYTLVMVQLGILGLASMLSIFYMQIKLSFHQSNRFFRDVGLTLPLLFLVIMLSDSYLLGHYTTLLFVFFSSFLYKQFEEN
jgi:O-antigen ligase